MAKKIIAISGTPGTGKTVLAKLLARRLGANLITLDGLLRKGLRYGYDRKRKTKVIDEKAFERAAKKELLDGINIVESHIAHLMKADIVFIVRTNPLVLEQRLKRRRWHASKIRENITAEILDEITTEALEKNRNVFELDTSEKGAVKSAHIAERIFNNFSYGKKYRAGKIDWMKKYGDILLKRKGKG